MLLNLKYVQFKMGTIALLIASAVMTAAVSVPTNADAATVAATPQTAISTVENATIAAQHAGFEVSGNPANTAAVSNSKSGVISVTSPGESSLSVKLPAGSRSMASVDNATTMDSSNSSAVTVVNPTTGGFQISQDMLGPSAPTAYSYKFDLPAGYHLVASTQSVNQGTIALTSASTSGSESSTNTIGFIEPAWAEDANGNSVPTHYVVSGETITQIVDTSDVSAWPVVADPTVSYGWVVYVHYSHDELGEVLWAGIYTGIATAMGIACTKIPVFWVAVACAVYIAVALALLWATFQTAFKRGGGEVVEFTYGANYYGYEYVGNNWS